MPSWRTRPPSLPPHPLRPGNAEAAGHEGGRRQTWTDVRRRSCRELLAGGPPEGTVLQDLGVGDADTHGLGVLAQRIPVEEPKVEALAVVLGQPRQHRVGPPDAVLIRSGVYDLGRGRRDGILDGRKLDVVVLA